MTTTKNTKLSFTADQITDLRDTQLLSWAKVAEALKLGSPGAARRAYASLVRPHAESVLPGRTAAALTPVHLADADLATIREAITGRTIVVQRKDRTEDIAVAKVTSAKAGTVNFNDGDKSRSVKAEAIIATK
ncbi:MAG: hypothetical protein ACR2G7_13975 [Acidimicrobiales bacterium]